MTRFTSIGMPKKSFVASAAEETRPQTEPESSTTAQAESSAPSGPKKRKRRGTRGLDPEESERRRLQHQEFQKESSRRQKMGLGRDPAIARKAKKSIDHSEERRMKRQDNRFSDTTCFACRGVGHAARDCPNVLLTTRDESALGGEQQGGRRKGGKKGGELAGGKCYRCNGYDHTLSQCTEPIDPANPTPYASCYICLASGHISAACPQNSKGVYVNGGNCKVCKSTAHRAKDCPVEKEKMEKEGFDFREERRRRGEAVVGEGEGVGADEDDFMGQSRVEKAKPSKGKMEKKPPANNSIRGPTKGAEDRFVVDQPAAAPIASKAKVVKF